MGTTKDDEDDKRIPTKGVRRLTTNGHGQRELTKGSRTGDDRSATKKGFVKLKHQLYK
jgi:hypothetical protein